MFTKILIANRSEIATRIMETCAQMGINTVAVYTDHDRDAPFVTRADEAVALPEGSSYLDVAAIVEAATRVGASAVHPGYGFLAENAGFATAVQAAGITFIGPNPDTIAAMGSKVEALTRMSLAGIPVLNNAVVSEGVDLTEIANQVGFPLLVKASGGGGGRGMRIVHEPDLLSDAVKSAQREALASSGDETVFLERYVARARHVEVQIFGDIHGNIIHVYDRECSVQRRFQKVIEEAPAPFITDKTRMALWDAAVEAGRAVGYVGAGTVEFVLEPDGRFAFLEMNTRLQVEHTVTEETTGLDLVRMQIDTACGGHTPQQADVPPVVGHAIETRIYAEKPTDGYAPSTGTVVRFRVPDGVRVDAGIGDGSSVTHHFDPMVAKVIASAPTRTETARVLARALSRSEIHGISTNRDMLVRVLSSNQFLNGPIDTNWLATLVHTIPGRDLVGMHTNACAAALAIAQNNRNRAPMLNSIPSGWRNVRSQPSQITLSVEGKTLEVAYTLGAGEASVTVDGEVVDVTAVHKVETDLVDMAVAGIRTRFAVHLNGADVYVDSVAGSDHFTIAERFTIADMSPAAGSMIAATPGKVVAVNVVAGDEVVVGDTLVVVEAMKMEQAIVATASGIVGSIVFGVGDHVAPGDVLISIDESVDSND